MIGFERTNRILEEYEEYFQPAIILDYDFNIIYKNAAAKTVNIKPRVGTNIKKYIDGANVEKLYAAVENYELKIIKLDVIPPVKRCVVRPCGNSAVALIFYDALDFLNDDAENEKEIFKEIEGIICKYSEAEKNIDFSTENVKKHMRFREHFKKHMINLNTRTGAANKTYCDIGGALNTFASGVSPYINSFGYKIAFYIEDKMFFYKLNENDLTTINFILTAFAFRHAIFSRADMYFTCGFNAATLKYEFRAGGDFAKNHKDMFVKDYLKDLKDIRYLDLNLAALIAKNNGLKLSVYFDPDRGKVCMVLTFCAAKYELASPFPGGRPNYITVEDVRGHMEIEYAGAFEGKRALRYRRDNVDF